MRVVAAICCAAAFSLAVGCGGNDESDQDPIGSWHGRLTENTGERFAIAVEVTTLTAGKRSAQVSYPGLGTRRGCRGFWRYKGQIQDSYNFFEQITERRNSKCFGTGDVQLTRHGTDRFDYRWSSGPNSSAGTLVRDGSG